MKAIKKENFSFNPANTLVFSFATLILIGSILLALPIATINNEGLPYLDALFTATSAVCVTGLVVVDTGTTFNLFGQIVILLLIQVGGLGIMTFAGLIAMALGKKISFKQRLMLQETLSQNSIQGIVRLVRYVFGITFVLEITGAVILGIHWFKEMGWEAFYYGLFHSVSAFNNAGFDLMGNFASLTSYSYDLITNLVIIILIVFGGIGFFVLWDLYMYSWNRRISFHSKIVLIITGVLVAIAFLVFFVLEFNNPETLGEMNVFDKLLASLFMAVTPRTAGFSTINVASMTQSSLFVTIILMFIGASPGSTGGGIKTSTFVVVLSYMFSSIKGKKQSVLFKRAISVSMYSKANAIVFLSLILIAVMIFTLTLSENTSFINILFEVVSAFGTVGLSTGITSDLTSVSKSTIIITMFVGRVGPLTLAYMLGQKSVDLIEYPTGNILIG
jgi:trk system potassium uptake protein TrkH